MNKILATLLLAVLPFLADAADLSRGAGHSDYAAGVAARESGDLEQAFALFKKAYESGSVEGAAAYGEALYKGHGTPPNPSGSAEALQFAASYLHPRGVLMYAKTFIPDGPTMIPLLELAADLGEAEAMEFLSMLYGGRMSVHYNWEASKAWTRKAAAAGSAKAMATMTTWAIEVWDLDEAEQLLHRTIEHGGHPDIAAQYALCRNLARAYAKEGYYAGKPWPRQPEKAAHWASVAASYNYEPPPLTPGFKVPEITEEDRRLLKRVDEIRVSRYWEREMEKARQARQGR